MTDLILYALIGAAVLSGLVGQRLTTTISGSDSAKALTTLLRLVVIGLWIWFAFVSGYWQIAVIIGASAVIHSAGQIAKSGASR